MECLWTKTSGEQVDDPGRQGGGVGFNEGEGYGEFEAAGAAASGIEVEGSLAALDGGFMGVAAEDERDAGGLGVEVEILDGVDEVDEVAGEGDGFGVREERAGVWLSGFRGVDVAADGREGREAAEAIEDCWVADVSGVEDVVGTGDSGDGFGAEEAVGVGEGGDEHGLSTG